jgi:hypothetical protein
VKTDAQLAAELVEMHGDQAAVKLRRALLILDTFPPGVMRPERLAKFRGSATRVLRILQPNLH